MAYKDREKQNAGQRLYYKRHKERNAEYYKILQITNKAYPDRQKCSIDGCEKLGEKHHPDYSKPLEIIWVCRQHHSSIFHPAQKCVICGDKVHGRGWCNKHYKTERMKIDQQYKKSVLEGRKRSWEAYKKRNNL